MPKSAPVAKTERQLRKIPRTKNNGWLYNSRRWRRLSTAFRRQFPLCQTCQENGKTTASAHVDHIREVDTHPDLAYDWSNLRALCVACHSTRHTRDGGVR